MVLLEYNAQWITEEEMLNCMRDWQSKERAPAFISPVPNSFQPVISRHSGCSAARGLEIHEAEHGIFFRPRVGRISCRQPAVRCHHTSPVLFAALLSRVDHAGLEDGRFLSLMGLGQITRVEHQPH